MRKKFFTPAAAGPHSANSSKTFRFLTLALGRKIFADKNPAGGPSEAFDREVGAT